MSTWNFADIWELAANELPKAPAITQGDATTTWSDFDRHANGIAQFLLGLGVSHQDKVALYLYNSPEYLETMFGAFKISLVPVNTNYRYTDDELLYLWDNADAICVVFHGAFAERVERIRAQLDKVRAWIWVDDESGECPSWATPFEEVSASSKQRVKADWTRSGDDLLMLYTGGTTGIPKGVMWRQDDLLVRLNSSGFRRISQVDGLEGVRKGFGDGGPGMSLLPACPLMHGTGCFTSIECLAEGGRLVLLEKRRFDPCELLDTIDREGVNGLVIVGDPFARPILEAMEAEPKRWALSSLVGIISSGAMWSEPIKESLAANYPSIFLIDAFSSSEALGMGSSVSSGAGSAKTAEFTLGPEVKVLSPEGKPVAPGSNEVGVLALGGRIPLGYYKDKEKSDATFKIVDGNRYSIPGDYAQVRADGSIHLLGRGSVCINTAGEKVFPEEVEEALKTYQGIADAVVVGIDDAKYGQAVVGIVEVDDGAAVPNEADLIAHVKKTLASYKAPQRIKVTKTIGRAANGKVDYSKHQKEAQVWAEADPGRRDKDGKVGLRLS